LKYRDGEKIWQDLVFLAIFLLMCVTSILFSIKEVKMNSDDLYFHSLKAVSPVDGRHRIITQPLSEWFSEFAFFKYRIFIEIEYLIALSELSSFNELRSFSEDEKEFLKSIVTNFSLDDAKIIQDLDIFGHDGSKPLNHDMKAVEYFIKQKLANSSLNDISEFVHFGLTSEDINNLALNCMVKGLLEEHYINGMIKILDKLAIIAKNNASFAMLSKTHGQAATPTTFGKEIANYLERLRLELVSLKNISLSGKLNGAIGNFNAHVFSSPETDWIKFSSEFITNLGFKPNLLTTQIEPHDSLCNLFSRIISINNILKDLTVDLWLYTSSGYLKQKNISTEVGSSTMPHKINPWRLEVAEGSTHESTAKFIGFITKLQASRLQRDLSDHEAIRAIGVGFAHSYIALLHLSEDLDRLSVNEEAMAEELKDNGEILTEAIQTLLRKHGYSKPYELLKDFSRGKKFSLEELHKFLLDLDINDELKEKLLTLTPENYIGEAEKLVSIALYNWDESKSNNFSSNNIKSEINSTNLEVKSEVREEVKDEIIEKQNNESKNLQIVAVLGGQWGDEGKGKVVDYIAKDFDVVARATGGNNAGHTIYINNEKHIFHLLPSAITWDNVDSILGNGMVIDPFVLFMEIDKIVEKGYSVDRLFISGEAHIIMLYHNLQDQFQELSKGDKKVGTTKRGIGPAYADKCHRTGIRVNDLFDKELLKQKININLIEKLNLFLHIYKQNKNDILFQFIDSIPDYDAYNEFKSLLNQLNVEFTTGDISENKINDDVIGRLSSVLTEIYFSFGERLKNQVVSSSSRLNYYMQNGKKILLEGAQGLLLDVDHGTYPFLTSSNPSIGGLNTGLGISRIDRTYSLLKAYTTRVGSGPFPTELGDEVGEYLRKQGHEFGSTTGRPRRCGWFDCVLTRHTSAINGPYSIITKLDVLAGIQKLKICNSYKYVGVRKYFNGELIDNGKIIYDFPANSDILIDCVPHEFIEVDGWLEDMSNIRNYEDLPKNAQLYLQKIEELGKVKISMISVGPLREQMIEIEKKDQIINKIEKEDMIKQKVVEKEAIEIIDLVETKEKTNSTLNINDYKAIIYDLDNTLIATNKFVRELILGTAKDLAKIIPFDVPTENDIKSVQSKNLQFEKMFDDLFHNPDNYMGKPIHEIALDKYRERAKLIVYNPIPGAIDVFNNLNSEGKIQVVVTNRTFMAKTRLNQAGFPNDIELFNPQSPEHRKPNPHCFDEALRFLETKGISKDKVLSVGDHVDDFIASKKANLFFVAVLTGETSSDEFEKLGLNKENIINSINEL
jgi:adenylosuccinate lyase